MKGRRGVAGYRDEIGTSSVTLRCSCGTYFQRNDGQVGHRGGKWSATLHADFAALAGDASAGTVRARCPGCGVEQKFEPSGNPVAY